MTGPARSCSHFVADTIRDGGVRVAEQPWGATASTNGGDRVVVVTRAFEQRAIAAARLGSRSRRSDLSLARLLAEEESDDAGWLEAWPAEDRIVVEHDHVVGGVGWIRSLEGRLGLATGALPRRIWPTGSSLDAMHPALRRNIARGRLGRLATRRVRDAARRSEEWRPATAPELAAFDRALAVLTAFPSTEVAAPDRPAVLVPPFAGGPSAPSRRRHARRVLAHTGQRT